MTAYEFFKDFAGPLATVIAAGAAVVVTVYFNKRQFEVSSAQRDIALDKLKFDAWEQRYEIYTQAKELLSYVAQQNDVEKIDHLKIRDLRVKIDEARFFFGPTVRAFLDQIDKTTETLLVNLGKRDGLHRDNIKEWEKIAEELTKDSLELSRLYAAMPEQFEMQLGLAQLARG